MDLKLVALKVSIVAVVLCLFVGWFIFTDKGGK